MSMGMAVYDENGVAIFDTTTITARLIEVIDVAAGASGSQTDSSFAGCVVVSISSLSSVQFASRPHKASISGTALTYTAVGTVTSSRLLVFAHT